MICACLQELQPPRGSWRGTESQCLAWGHGEVTGTRGLEVIQGRRAGDADSRTQARSQAPRGTSGAPAGLGVPCLSQASGRRCSLGDAPKGLLSWELLSATTGHHQPHPTARTLTGFCGSLGSVTERRLLGRSQAEGLTRECVCLM